MNEQNTTEVTSYSSINKVGFYSAIVLAVTTIIAFCLAITATPGGVVASPYLDTLKLFPKDYIWMFVSIPLLLSYVILMIVTSSIAKNDKNIFSQIGVAFAIISASILLSNYFVQFSVVPASLLNNNTDGILLLTQYNLCSIFIALEELGYIMMALSFVFIAPIFGKDRLDRLIKLMFISAFLLSIVSFVIVSIQYGINRGYIFEIAVISITWLTLIINGILLSIFYRKK
jgi:hypothetical protein